MENNNQQKTPNHISNITENRHSLFEDFQGVITGVLFMAVGLMFFQKAYLVTGGVVGMAILLNYATGISFATLFFIINAPFYFLAWKKMGKAFTIKTICAVSLLAFFSEIINRWIIINTIDPLFAAIAGGLLCGTGILILFRHRASVGGINIFVMWCQEKFGWRAGVVQLIIDTVILICSAYYLSLWQLALSLIATISINFSLAVNHRPGRYTAF